MRSEWPGQVTIIDRIGQHQEDKREGGSLFT